jgi:hypothetical protein
MLPFLLRQGAWQGIKEVGVRVGVMPPDFPWADCPRALTAKKSILPHKIHIAIAAPFLLK